MANDSNDKQADEWINTFNLIPHTEGGFYSETYRSNDNCILERYNKQNRSCSTAIYYLLKTPESPKSVFHRIKADEMWHFYKGLPLIIHELDEETSLHTQYILNNELGVHKDARPQILIPYGKWFAAEIMTTNIGNKADNYTLCGCTCTPGFDFNDFECAKRSYLLSKFPNFKDLIIRLTPPE